jgi:hypothetical protein
MTDYNVTPIEKRPSYLTIKQAVQTYPAVFPTESAVRNLIYKADDRPFTKGVMKGNGFAMALIRLGRKILLDEAKLIEWIESHRKGGHVYA